MQVAIPIFDRLTALDAVGPYEVLSRLPGAEVRFLGAETGPKRTDTGALALVADAAFGELREPEIVVVPGGAGTRGSDHAELLDWLRHAHTRSRFTTSVCTGALLLGAAGLLEGLRATTHWLFLDRLRELGANPVTDQRVVEEGKVITAAGVSAGIDMALLLAERIAGERVAQAVQLAIEYAPEPPLDAGSTRTAPETAIADVRRAAARSETL